MNLRKEFEIMRGDKSSDQFFKTGLPAKTVPSGKRQKDMRKNRLAAVNGFYPVSADGFLKKAGKLFRQNNWKWNF